MIRHQDESPKDVNLDDYNDLRVVEYEIKSIVVSEDKKSAVVDAEITYYFATRGTLKTIRDAQNWWYLEETENWFLDGALPAFQLSITMGVSAKGSSLHFKISAGSNALQDIFTSVLKLQRKSTSCYW